MRRRRPGLLAASSILAIVMIPIAVSLIGNYFDRSLTTPATKDRADRVSVGACATPRRRGAAALRTVFRRKNRQADHRICRNPAGPVRPGDRHRRLQLDHCHVRRQNAAGASCSPSQPVSASDIFFGGPTPDDRTALALATASRHPGVALAIAGANVADQKPILGSRPALPDRKPCPDHAVCEMARSPARHVCKGALTFLYGEPQWPSLTTC